MWTVTRQIQCHTACRVVTEKEANKPYKCNKGVWELIK